MLLRNALAAKIQNVKKAEVVDFNNPQAVYSYWLNINEKIEAGEIKDDKTIRDCKAYINSDSCKAMKRFFENFGLSVTSF